MITVGTDAMGVQSTARSIGCPTAPTDGKAGSPRICWRLGLIGKMGPRNPPDFKFSNTTHPTVPGRSVAPTTATDCGLNNLFRLYWLMLFPLFLPIHKPRCFAFPGEHTLQPPFIQEFTGKDYED